MWHNSISETKYKTQRPSTLKSRPESHIQHSTQHSTAQHSTAQRQHSTGQDSEPEWWPTGLQRGGGNPCGGKTSPPSHARPGPAVATHRPSAASPGARLAAPHQVTGMPCNISVTSTPCNRPASSPRRAAGHLVLGAVPRLVGPHHAVPASAVRPGAARVRTRPAQAAPWQI